MEEDNIKASTDSEFAGHGSISFLAPNYNFNRTTKPLY